LLDPVGKALAGKMVWVPILRSLIWVEVGWFGARCMAYLSDMWGLFEKMIKTQGADSGEDHLTVTFYLYIVSVVFSTCRFIAIMTPS
jgi:hypothetical protein